MKTPLDLLNLSPERLAWMQRRARMQGMDAAALQSLAERTVEACKARHAGNQAAALAGAQNSLVIHLGGVLKDADVKRFEEALKSGSKARKERKGGQHEAAPVPA